MTAGGCATGASARAPRAGSHPAARLRHISGSLRRGRRRSGRDGCVQAGLDRGEPLDQPLQRFVHGFERVLRALVAFGLVRVQRLEVAPECAMSPPAGGMSAATARATRSAVATASSRASRT